MMRMLQSTNSLSNIWGGSEPGPPLDFQSPIFDHLHLLCSVHRETASSVHICLFDLATLVYTRTHLLTYSLGRIGTKIKTTLVNVLTLHHNWMLVIQQHWYFWSNSLILLKNVNSKYIDRNHRAAAFTYKNILCWTLWTFESLGDLDQRHGSGSF